MSTINYDDKRNEVINRKYWRNKLISFDPNFANDTSLLYGDAAEYRYRDMVNQGLITEALPTASVTFFNVKQYGAVGNGVTDDSAAIQAALDAVPAGGGCVYIPAGDYAIGTTLQIKVEGTSLIGDGAGNRTGATQLSVGTRLKAKAGITGAVILVQRVANDRPLQGVHIKDLAVDGALIGTGVEGIVFRSNQGSMDHVSIWNCSGNGLRVAGYTTPSWETYDSIFSHLLIGYCGGVGAYLDTKSSDTHWSHCVFLSNNDNMSIYSASLQVTGCHFYTATRYDIHFNGGGSRSKFANCKIEGSGQHLVYIDSTNGGYSDIQFTGNGFSTLSQSTATNTYDYVMIDGPSGIGAGRITFVGNSFNLKGGSTVKCRYGINLATGASQNISIIGNAFGPASHFGTGPINQAGSTSLLPFIKANANVPDLVYPNVQIGTVYTLALSDADSSVMVEMNNAAATTVTVPPNSTSGMAKGAQITLTQVGAGTVTIAAGAGVTLNTVAPKTLVSKGQWATIRLYQRATNSWIVEGDLA